MISAEYREFISFGGQIGATIEQRLNVPMASLTHPVDLANIGLSVYAGDQVSPRLRVNPLDYAQKVAATYSNEIFARSGINRGQFIREYPDLIVRSGQYDKGKIATALKETRNKLSEEETRALESYLGRLAALYFQNEPQITPKPEVTFRHIEEFSVIKTQETELYRGDTPRIFVEYGPGANAFGRFKEELRPISLSVLIERSNYVNSLLYAASVQFGYHHDIRSAPAVITRRDGISLATKDMLKGGFSGLVDLILMSMVHSAGAEEIKAGITNGYTLLREGGTIIAQSPYDPLSSQDCSGMEMLETLKSCFGDSSENMYFFQQDAKFVQQTTGRINKGFRAVFVK